MYNILTILFSVLESDIWDIKTLNNWSDSILLKVDSPQVWLTSLSVCQSKDEAKSIIRQEIENAFIVIPENIVELIVGFILLNFDSGNITLETAYEQLLDYIDSYNSTKNINAELSVKLDLQSSEYNELRAISKIAIDYLKSEEMIMKENKFIAL